MSFGKPLPNERSFSYILVVECRRKTVLRIKRLGNPVLDRGTYLYVGSANISNPASRVLRHFRKEKRIKWHVDYLTTSCEGLYALLASGITEDSLYHALSEKYLPAVHKFGSSDKPKHKTHLFKAPEGVRAGSLKKLLLGLGAEKVEIMSNPRFLVGPRGFEPRTARSPR